MKLLMDLFEALVIDVGVDLGGCDISVAEELLNDAQIGSILKQVGREGVPQEVRIHVLLDASLLGAVFYNLTNAVRAEGAAAHR